MFDSGIRVLFGCACLAVAGCGQQGPAPSSAPAATTAVNAAADGNDRIGIPECDDYLDRYEACISSRAPQNARPALAAALAQTRASWRKTLSASTQPAALAMVCQRARAAARASLVAYGCTDF